MNASLAELARKVVHLPSLLLYRVATAASALLSFATLSPSYIRTHALGVYASEACRPAARGGASPARGHPRSPEGRPRG